MTNLTRPAEPGLKRDLGNLALSRALGDFEFKKNYSLGPEAQIITANPDVTCHEITDEDEFLGHADGAEADGEGDLGSFVDDAVIEDASVEEGVVDRKAGRGYDWWFCPGLLEFFQAVLRFGS